MVRIASALSLRVPDSHKRKLSYSGIASLLATGLLVAAPVAHARTTQIQILNRGTAFGGHSFTGVELRFDPRLHAGFVRADDGRIVLAADAVTVVENRCYARGNITYVTETV